MRKAFVLVPSLVSLSMMLPAQVPGACLLEDQAFVTANGGCQDVATGGVWSALEGIGTWNAAVQICDNLVEGGFDDWRLPAQSDLQTVMQNGGYSHLNMTQGFYRFWSSSSKGTWAYYVTETGATDRSLKTSSYWVLCVRGLATGGHGGGHHRLAGPTVDPRLSATHILDDQGVWHVLLHAPQHACQPYLVVAGLRDASAPLGLRSPTLLGQGTFGSKVFDPGPGRLDVHGRCAVRIDLGALRLPDSLYADLALAVVILDPTQPGWVVYPLPLNRR